jgi:Cu(I)/Ag(I) efflux system membrane fusion protein
MKTQKIRAKGGPAGPWLAALLLAEILAGCGSGDADPTAEEMGMTAEEHAAMEMAETPEPMETMDTGSVAMRSPVHLTSEQERALGVTYTTARRETLTRAIRTVGRIEAPEPGIADITPKIEGFVEDLFVNSTGEPVRRGQPLLTLYSPMLVAAQEELLTARRLASQLDTTAGEGWHGAQSMLEAARRRLLYWDVTREQVEHLESTGSVTKTLTFVAPVSGIVLEKDVIEGQRVMPGARLYRIADLSSVWVEGAAYPGEHLMGTVSFVYPVVDVQSRTNRVRVTVPNPDLTLKPGMFATVFFDVQVVDDDVTVPLDAVIVTGERNLVFVRDVDGMLTPREVVLGARAGRRVQILQGLAEDEMIVASANFLVDAGSRLAATGGAMPGMQHAGHGSALEPQADVTQPGAARDTTPAEHDHD